ncbi:hypothetical protein MRX96_022025 [Rhipicephalus microplus]
MTSQTAVNRIIQAFRDDRRFTDVEGSGRPRATTEEEDRLIMAAIVADPFQSAENIREALSLKVSSETVRRRPSELGLQSFIAAPKPCLSNSHLQKRLIGRRHKDNLFVLTQCAEIARKEGLTLLCCFVDVEKAYDNVPHGILFTRLETPEMLKELLATVRHPYAGNSVIAHFVNVESRPKFRNSVQTLDRSEQPVQFIVDSNGNPTQDMKEALTGHLDALYGLCALQTLVYRRTFDNAVLSVLCCACGRAEKTIAYIVLECAQIGLLRTEPLHTALGFASENGVIIHKQ